ncbi:unnamed protein product, partial [Closterium sp. NIES-54]
MRCNVVWCGATWCGVEWCGVPKHHPAVSPSLFSSFLPVERKVSQLETGPWIEGDAAAIPSLADSLPATITTANVPASPSISSRVVCYMTAPSSLVKSVLATELMRYSRADAGGYLVEVYVATPDVPYGNTFRTEMQFCITPSPGTTSLLPSLHSPTPDVPYGNTFRTKMQFCITPGP